MFILGTGFMSLADTMVEFGKECNSQNELYETDVILFRQVLMAAKLLLLPVGLSVSFQRACAT